MQLTEEFQILLREHASPTQDSAPTPPLWIQTLNASRQNNNALESPCFCGVHWQEISSPAACSALQQSSLPFSYPWEAKKEMKDFPKERTS